MKTTSPARFRLEGKWDVYSWPIVTGVPGTPVTMTLLLPDHVQSKKLFTKNGWQSWSAPWISVLGKHETQMPCPSDVTGGSRRNLWTNTALPKGDSSYDMFIIHPDLTSGGWVAGIAADGTSGGTLTVNTMTRTLSVTCEVGSTGQLPDVWVWRGECENPSAAARELVNKTNPFRVNTTPLMGWSSWRAHGKRLTEQIVKAELEAAKIRNVPLNVFHIDDAWQTNIGDWAANEHFADGMRSTANRIEDAGLEPSIWIAPFLTTATAGPWEWVARSSSGQPIPVVNVGHWGGTVYALDPSISQCQEWLTQLGVTLRNWGFKHIKVDFCFAASLTNEHSKRTQASWETLRQGLNAFKQGTRDASLTLCGSPLWSAIGFADSMRVGPDVLREWKLVNVPEGLDVREAAGLENTWRAAKLREWMNGTCWVNDPDSVILSSPEDRGIQDACIALQWSQWCAEQKGNLFLGDSLPLLSNERLELWRQLTNR